MERVKESESGDMNDGGNNPAAEANRFRRLIAEIDKKWAERGRRGIRQRERRSLKDVPAAPGESEMEMAAKRGLDLE